MTPEQFLTFADPLPEPMLLMAGSGVVLAGNRAVEKRLGVALYEVGGKNLADVVADSPDEIAHYLRSCSRSRSLVLGSLQLLAQGGSVACRTEGTLLRPRTDGSEAVLMLRLIPKESAVGQFVALNQRIEDLGREIHRRKNAEAAARQQAERLRVTLHSIGDGVIVTDAEGRVQLLNPVAQAMTGWTLEEATDVPLPDVFHIVNEDTRHAVENPALRALREGKIVGLANHTVLISKDGQERPIDDCAAPIRDASENVVGSVLVFRDISERKQAEQEVRFQARLLDTVGQAAVVTDPEGTIIFWNRFAETLYGWASGEALGRNIMDVVVAPEAAAHATEIMGRLRAGEEWSGEFPVRRRDGTTFPAFVTDSPVLDDRGNLKAIIGVSVDITDRKQLEQSLRFMADASATLTTLVDYQSTLQKVAALAVPHFADWCAVDMAEPGGTLRRVAVAHVDAAKVRLAQELEERYPADPDVLHGAYRVLRTGKSEMMGEIPDALLVESARDEDHLRIVRELGLKSYMCVPLQARGKTLGVVTFVTAESGRRYTESDLAFAEELARRSAIAIENAQLYAELRDADRRKDEFLATLAHELRNPLAPIRNALQILKMPRVDAATVGRSRDMMERQVHQLVRLVDDLLDVSRVMQGKIELRKEPVELATVVARGMETAQPLIEAQGHQLEISLPPDSLLLDADPVRMAQIVGNLLTNAAKYTEPGGRIWLTAEREGTEAFLRVRDSGIGIAPDILPRIFELFVQVDHAATRSQGGLGIGLTLVKNLLGLHGGSITAHSDGLGIGSVYPMVRSHTLLNNLHPIVEKTPLVMFYPGCYDEKSLRLFGKIKSDNYYRAFRLIP